MDFDNLRQELANGALLIPALLAGVTPEEHLGEIESNVMFRSLIKMCSWALSNESAPFTKPASSHKS